MNMIQLRSLAKERNLRGYSRLRKADLINFLRERGVRLNEPPQQQPTKDELPMEHMIEQPLKDEGLSKRQCKRHAQKASKLSKKSKSLRIEIDDLKSQKDSIEDKINKASSSTSSRFKQKRFVL